VDPPAEGSPAGPGAARGRTGIRGRVGQVDSTGGAVPQLGPRVVLWNPASSSSARRSCGCFEAERQRYRR